MISTTPKDGVVNPKTENTILFHAIQMHLNNSELEDLNSMLLQFVEICTHYRDNSKLAVVVESIRSELHNS